MKCEKRGYERIIVNAYVHLVIESGQANTSDLSMSGIVDLNKYYWKLGQHTTQYRSAMLIAEF